MYVSACMGTEKWRIYGKEAPFEEAPQSFWETLP